MNDDLSGFSMLELFRLEAESQAEILSAGVLAIEEQRQSAETIESLKNLTHVFQTCLWHRNIMVHCILWNKTGKKREKEKTRLMKQLPWNCVSHSNSILSDNRTSEVT